MVTVNDKVRIRVKGQCLGLVGLRFSCGFVKKFATKIPALLSSERLLLSNVRKSPNYGLINDLCHLYSKQLGQLQ